MSSQVAIPMLPAKTASVDAKSIVDSVAKPPWSFATDLAVLVGGGLEAVGDELARRGQRRILAYLPGDAPSRYPAHTVVVRSAAELDSALSRWRGDPPRQVKSARAQESGVSAHEAAQLYHLIDLKVLNLCANVDTISRFGETALEQVLVNIPAIARWPGITSLAGAFRDRPMVVVAPGPSLANNIELLARVKGKSVLVAFSHSYAAVVRAGVVPDFVATVDPQELSRHFAGMPHDQVKAFFSAATVHPSIFEVPARRHVTFPGYADLDTWVYAALGETALLAVGGSVATAAFGLGLHLGCSPIVFVGLDLSYPAGKRYIDGVYGGDHRLTFSADGKTATAHGRGLPQAGQPFQGNMVELPGYYGGTVPTSLDYALYHRWFVEMAARVGAGTALVNATEGGAFIAGMEHLPLTDAISRYVGAEVDIDAVLDLCVADAGRVPALMSFLGETVALLGQCIQLGERCARLAERAARSPAGVAKLQRWHPTFSATLTKLTPLLALRMPEIGREETRLGQARSPVETLRSAGRLYHLAVQTSRWFRTRLERSLAQLELTSETRTATAGRPANHSRPT